MSTSTYYAQNRERIRAQRKAYYQANAELVKNRVHAYYRDNREKILKKSEGYRLKNKAVLKENGKKYYQENKDVLRERSREYHRTNRDLLVPKMRDRYHRNKGKYLPGRKKYYQAHRDQIIAYQKEYARKYPEKIKARSKRYRLENLETLRAYDRERSKIRYADPAYRARVNDWRKENLPRMRALMASRILDLKRRLGGKCHFCGYDEHPEIFEFDHKVRPPKEKRGRKRHHLDRIWGVFKDSGRFNMLCPNCHAIKSSLEKQRPWTDAAWSYWSRRFQILAMFDSECGECRYNENVLALEFDHKNGLGGRKRQPAVCDVPKYPDEFQLLCANCHTIKTLKLNREKTGQAAS